MKVGDRIKFKAPTVRKIRRVVAIEEFDGKEYALTVWHTSRCNPQAEWIEAKYAELWEVVERNTSAELTCHYFPDEYQIAFDEDDEEIETGEASSDGTNYSCDKCGYTMLGGYDFGWFDETEGKYGGFNYKPRFGYCPSCGAKVVSE